jgi:hypothetical protein
MDAINALGSYLLMVADHLSGIVGVCFVGSSRVGGKRLEA